MGDTDPLSAFHSGFLVFGAERRVALCLLTFNAFNGSWMLLGIMWPTPQVVSLFVFVELFPFRDLN